MARGLKRALQTTRGGSTHHHSPRPSTRDGRRRGERSLERRRPHRETRRRKTEKQSHSRPCRLTDRPGAHAHTWRAAS